MNAIKYSVARSDIDDGFRYPFSDRPGISKITETKPRDPYIDSSLNPAILNS